MPHAAFTSWHEEQSKNRAKYKDSVEKNFASEGFWREERERLRRQIEQVSREAWKELHPNRSQIPRKNLQQIVYQTQRAFDRRHGELRNSVALHYQTRAVNWGEMLHGMEGAPPEVTELLQTHARNQKELLLREWMKCLIKRTREDACQIARAKSVKSARRDAQRLANLNFFGDIYLEEFVEFVQGPSLFAEKPARIRREPNQRQTLESFERRFESELEQINSWRELGFAEVLDAFAAMTGWTFASQPHSQTGETEILAP